jgi:hypothetical protein
VDTTAALCVGTYGDPAVILEGWVFLLSEATLYGGSGRASTWLEATLELRPPPRTLDSQGLQATPKPCSPKWIESILGLLPFIGRTLEFHFPSPENGQT